MYSLLSIKTNLLQEADGTAGEISLAHDQLYGIPTMCKAIVKGIYVSYSLEIKPDLVSQKEKVR